MNYNKTQHSAAFANASYKEAHIYPSLEEFQVDALYSFTVSPKDQHNGVYDRVLMICENMRNNICPLFGGHQKLYPELSTKSQNLHWHGYISFSSVSEIIEFYMQIHHIKDLCTFKIKELFDDEIEGFVPFNQWTIYISKQRPFMHCLMASWSLPYSMRYQWEKSIIVDKRPVEVQILPKINKIASKMNMKRIRIKKLN